MIYGLPTSVEVCGTAYEINSDFRVVLDIFEVLNDPDLLDQEKGFFTLGFFYPDFENKQYIYEPKIILTDESLYKRVCKMTGDYVQLTGSYEEILSL